MGGAARVRCAGWFLAFRQQTVAVRREYIDRLVDAAQAAVDLLKPIPATAASPGN